MSLNSCVTLLHALGKGKWVLRQPYGVYYKNQVIDLYVDLCFRQSQIEKLGKEDSSSEEVASLEDSIHLLLASQKDLVTELSQNPEALSDMLSQRDGGESGTDSSQGATLTFSPLSSCLVCLSVCLSVCVAVFTGSIGLLKLDVRVGMKT